MRNDKAECRKEASYEKNWIECHDYLYSAIKLSTYRDFYLINN